MLFSQPEIAAYMNDEFECAWESVRPVPRVTIDFGDGRVLERTLHGNVATYFCTSEGEVLDILPGIVDAREYAWRLGRILRLVGRVDGSRRSAVSLARLSSQGDRIADAEIRREWLRERVRDWHESAVAAARAGSMARWDPLTGNGVNWLKSRVERPIDESLVPLALEDAAALRADTEHNRAFRQPLVSELLLERPLARPSELTREVFARVLGVDLDDPYLGLAPDVLGGEPGRR